MLTSDSKLSCPDHCIYDAGHNCRICDRYENTLYSKLEKLAEQIFRDWKDSLLPWDDPALMTWPSKGVIFERLHEFMKEVYNGNGQLG